MNNKTLASGQRSIEKKGGKLIPALCNLLGTLIILTVVAFCLPLTVPRLMGYEIYNVVSGSMEPAIPVGSVIYVAQKEPEEIREGDVIAFMSEGTVVTHRVVANRLTEGDFVTKGDANAAEDMHTVSYGRLIGYVAYHFPVLGDLMFLYTSTVGKVYMICFAACGAMLNMLAGRLRQRRAGEQTAEEETAKKKTAGKQTDGKQSAGKSE